MSTDLSLFSSQFLARFINKNELRRELGDVHAGWDDEIRSLNYSQLLQRLVDNNTIEPDDPVFFKLNGEPRVKTSAREQVLNQHLENYCEENAPEPVDPLEYLKELYGPDDALNQAIKIAEVDIDAAAQAAVNEDGPSACITHGATRDRLLENGAVYLRIA